ncbi:hypothetical protein VFPFJ_04073 [Purpureocillium lilacinum]|uniref:Uncharacterized protein n=1 Tax=Purpureocillium lilacinum TaxID=33203 RepID=A0A179GYC6_PURLI|nr:hypothetical protein VFPFJ_04073 [Purpureocillium lilacinum]OAQ82293.1 hypothetical protein VFPBJ_04877 [Purpureocillium lilacinum]OAQ92333.1 hypothetical protein VFPFJ_04073 [Purpureocillium lilacinum]
MLSTDDLATRTAGATALRARCASPGRECASTRTRICQWPLAAARRWLGSHGGEAVAAAWQDMPFLGAAHPTLGGLFRQNGAQSRLHGGSSPMSGGKPQGQATASSDEQ